LPIGLFPTALGEVGTPLPIAYFDCFAGASGDMLLASLLDAGLALDDLRADLARLDLAGYALEAHKVTRQGLSGTHLLVQADDSYRPARTLPDVEAIIAHSSLADDVKARSLAIFHRLAQAEAAVHGTTPEQIHFHEIGAVDSLVDIVGFAAALQRLGIDKVYASSLPLGSGTVQTEHGRLPVPAPATLALLAQVGAPTLPGPGPGELLTPTGAALLTSYATFERPALAIQAVGYGFGTRELDWPNALRVWLGTRVTTLGSDEVTQLTCNLDDATGEALGYLMDCLLAAGALDVWFTPIQMKKNRPATQLALLARSEDANRLAAIVLQETPTLGIRSQTLSRYCAARQVYEVKTPWGPVRVKAKRLGDQVISASPEYDDCARLANQAHVPLADVMEAARQAAGHVQH
jgi:pyridinium-3,5-bisthiocarboxylic acid mononucleotide nickel chelatase